MDDIFLSDLKAICKYWDIPESSIRALIDPKSTQFDPTFPKPFSRDNKFYWSDDEMGEWSDIRKRLKYLRDIGFIEFLKLPDFY